MAVRVTDRITSDGRKFERMLKDLEKLEVRIGFQAGDASEDDGTDICDVAAWNELGTSRIPARPFIRQSVDNHEGEINAFLQSKKKELVSGANAEQVLKQIGIFQKDLMQNEITTGSFIPNAPSTIRKKKSSKPLIDTGRMRQSVNYQIKPKGSGN